MTPGEQKLMAAYANTFREMAATSDDPDVAQRRLLTAKSFERHLSRDLTEQHERRALGALTRPRETDVEADPTRGQLARRDELLSEHPGCDVFIDPLVGGDCSLEVWPREGRELVHHEIVNPEGEPI